MKFKQNVNKSLTRVIFPPASDSLSSRKQNKVKYKQKYQDLTIRVLLLFIFRFFTHSPICRLPFVFSVFKGRKSKTGRKAEKKNTRKQRIYKENSTSKPIQTKFKLFLFLPFIGIVSNSVADPKPEKEQRTKQKKSSLKV